VCSYSVPSPSNTCTPLIHEPLVGSFVCDCFVPLNALIQHTHTCRNMHDHEANSCLPRPGMQIKMCDYGIQCKHPPPSLHLPSHFWQIFTTCITCSTCLLKVESEASWARLSSRSKQAVMLCLSRAFRHQCPGLETSFSFCTACLCILLPWRYTNTIQPFQGNRVSLEWSNWFQRKLCITVCMCVYMHSQHFMYKVSGAEQPETDWKGQIGCL